MYRLLQIVTCMSLLAVTFCSPLSLGSLVFHSTNAACDIPSQTTATGTSAPNGIICPGDLIFEDNFDTLDLRKWQHELSLGGGGNGEFQWNANSRLNSNVSGSKLLIKPTIWADTETLQSATLDINGGGLSDACTNPQSYGCLRTGSEENYLNPIKSARLRTMNSFSFKYGKVEVRAKAPSGDWLWPAIWMMPRDNQYSTWPQSGEIDIMETRGNTELYDASGKHIGAQMVASTLEWGPDTSANKYSRTHYETWNTAGFNSDFHNYQLEWTPYHIVFSVDDEEIGRVEPPAGGFWELGELESSGFANPWQGATIMAPFDQEFYIILSVAVGGTSYFDDGGTNNNGAKPWSNNSPTPMKDFWLGKEAWLKTWELGSDSALQVDYVKVWAL